MNAHISNTLLRLTAIAATVMTLMAALMPFAPASAAPNQGAGYWQDTFSDSTGINASASTNISVSGGDVKLTLGSSTSTYNYVGVTVAGGPHDAYYCDVDDWQSSPAANLGGGDGLNLNAKTEATLAQYQQINSSNNVRWTTTNPGANDEVFLWSNMSISESSTAVTNISLLYEGYSTGGACTARMWIYNNSASAWEILSPDASFGAGADNTMIRWKNTSCANYINSSGIVQWGVSLSISNNTMQTDYVQASVTYNTYYSTPGILTSVNITPANLQSWGTFNATDNTTCLPYRKAISINGTGTALTNYQVNISVSYVSGNMNSDFSDLRFKDGSGNMLNYWIESYVASTSAQVWVKVPSIAASGNTTIYMYYGNAAATSASNGSNTFIFFDDFSGDLSKWTKEKNGGNISIVSGYLNCSGGIPSGTYGHTVLGSSASYTGFTNGIIEGKVYLATDGIAEVGYRGNYNANTGYKSRMDNRSTEGIGNLIWPYTDALWTFISTGGGPLAPPVPAGAWYKFSIAANGSSLNISCAGQTLSGTNTSYAGPGEISLQNHYGAYVLYDDIRVRQYASPEPAITPGSEQSGSYCGFTNLNSVTSITYKILRASDNAVLCTINAAQAAAGYDISSCAGATSSIKLRADFSTSNISLTPVLSDWGVTWTSVIPVTIEVTAPGNISSWTLSPGVINIVSGTLNVTVSPSSTNWSVTANDSDKVFTNGSMTLWTGSAYNTSVKLANPMNLSSGSYNITLPGGGTIATGTGNNSAISIAFQQYVTWDDVPGDYRIVITFIGTINP